MASTKNVGLLSALVGFALAFAVGAPGCSGGQRDLCSDNQVRCEGNLVCDPADGLCKCGGRGGVVCPSGFDCDQSSNTCVSTRCATVTCANQTSCDVNDGKCKCGGTGGTVCGENDSCDPVAKKCQAPIDCRQVSCPKNQTCDPSTGTCLCGADVCAPNRFCSVTTSNQKTCVDSLCAGVTCAGATVCDPNDGVCKCNGAVCTAGDACQCPAGSDGGCADNLRSCRPSSACIGVSCDGGSNCDPTDGQCRCGGPGGPACGAVQICALGPPAQCQGGNQCNLADGGVKNCGGGTSCDPEDGVCKCGGRGGTECRAPVTGPPADPGEVCVATSTSTRCRTPCDPKAPDCPAGEFCYFDSSAATPVAYCSPNTGTRAEGQSCQTATECFSTSPAPRSLHCLGLQQGQFGLCRSYCDTSQPTASCSQVPRPQTCLAIQGAQGGVGFCQPQ